MKKTVITLFFITIFCSVFSFGQNGKDTLRVLFVGNSYTHINNLPQITSILSGKVNTKLITRASTVGGGRLSEHWKGERGLKTKEKIKNGNFDVVVLQGFSMAAINKPDSLTKYLKLFCNYIRKNGAEPYFYLTWARKRIPQYQKTIDSVYYSVANEMNATVVPVGRAWQLVEKLRPDVELFQIDGSHPSKFGAILSAYIFVATITKQIPHEPSRGYGIKDINGENISLMYFYKDEISDLVFFQKVAETIVFNK
jgi:hypothetical protein